MIAFAVIWYVMPALLCAISEVEGHFTWPRERDDVWIVFALAVACIVVPVTLIPANGADRRNQGSTKAPVALWGLALLVITAGCLTHLQGNASWRYGGDSVSERIAADGAGTLLATALLQTVGPMIAWWIILMRPALWLERSWTSRATRALAALAALSGVNGLNSAVWAFFSSACMIWPLQCAHLLFYHAETRRTRGTIVTLVGVGILAVAFAVAGMFAKTGRYDEAPWESHTTYDFFVQRHAVHFQHAMGALEIGIDESGDPNAFTARRAIGPRSTAYRIGVLMGDPSWGSRPDPSSLGRWTIERFANYDLSNDTRSGSTPGLIGTFALCYPPPWSLISVALYSVAVALALNWFLRGCARLSILGCTAVAFMPVRFATDLPTELVNPIGVSAAIIMLAAIARLCQSNAPLGLVERPSMSRGIATPAPTRP